MKGRWLRALVRVRRDEAVENVGSLWVGGIAWRQSAGEVQGLKVDSNT
jgi:hypothetical protein